MQGVENPSSKFRFEDIFEYVGLTGFGALVVQFEGIRDPAGNMSVSGDKRVVLRYGAAVVTIQVLSAEVNVIGTIVSAAEVVCGIDTFGFRVLDSHSTWDSVQINAPEDEEGQLISEVNGIEVTRFVWMDAEGLDAEGHGDNEHMESSISKLESVKLVECVQSPMEIDVIEESVFTVLEADVT